MAATLLTSAVGLPRSGGVDGGAVGLVMTMGALHDGHTALVRRARSHVGDGGTVVVTVFVNPTQFGAGEDFEQYPRSLQSDMELSGEAGADIVLAPDATEVYGPARSFRPDSITIDAGPLGGILEGASRPGHFRGVLTVVAKFLQLTRPDAAFFGEKDYQQLVLIRRMVSDLSMPIEIVGVPTVRENDGLALSSRNRYLSEAERAAAVALPRALDAAASAATAGAAAAEAAGRESLAAAPGIELDYLVVTDPELGPAPERGEARVLAAATVGTTRLIDNRSVMVDR